MLNESSRVLFTPFMYIPLEWRTVGEVARGARINKVPRSPHGRPWYGTGSPARHGPGSAHSVSHVVQVVAWGAAGRKRPKSKSNLSWLHWAEGKSKAVEGGFFLHLHPHTSRVLTTRVW